MNLYHLKYFYDAARNKSVTKAAVLNRVGQSAVSKAILNLETFLKTDLITHKRKQFELTDHGQMAFSFCQKIFSLTDELQDELLAPKTLQGQVSIGLPSSLAESTKFVNALEKINNKYPKVKIKLMLGRTDLVASWINDGVVDLGYILDNVNLEGFEKTHIAHGYFYLVASKNLKQDWRRDGILTTEKKPEIRKLRQIYEHSFQQNLAVKMEIGSWGVIKKFVINGLGVGLLPDYTFEGEIKAGIVKTIEPSKLKVPYEICVIRHPNRFASRMVKAVIAELK